MLECYLLNNGIDNLKHVIGEKTGSQGTHAWTIIGENLIVDITLDQFSDSFPPVYIGEPLPMCAHFRIEIASRKYQENEKKNGRIWRLLL